MARALEPYGASAEVFVDIDPDKIGRRARGVPIVPPSGLDPEAHFVVVAVGARGARTKIRRALVERGFVEGSSFLFAA